MNYRGVAALSTMPKLLDAMMNNGIALHVDASINKQQHGFTRRKLAKVQLGCEEFNGMWKPDRYCIDFKKAFDHIPFAVMNVLFEA